MSALRVLAFTPQPFAGPAGRYRVYQWREPLRTFGIELEVAPFFDTLAFARLYERGGWTRKAWDLARLTRELLSRLREAKRHDLAFVHRELWPLAGDWPLEALKRHQPRWLFDLDDAVFMRNVSEANQAMGDWKAHATAVPLAAGAGAVAAGNQWLAAWTRSVRPGRDAAEVEVIPTAVDSELWRPAGTAPGEPVRLVWIGSPSTLHYLQEWLPALATLTARHPALELHVIGATLEHAGVRCVSHAWHADTERKLVQACHIGLAPLGTGDWERGKCGLKLLLYMALGLPAVATNAGVHPDIVTPGEDGLLVQDSEALVDALDRLVRDTALRLRLGSAGRATLVRRYSVQAIAPRLASLLKRAAERS